MTESKSSQLGDKLPESKRLIQIDVYKIPNDIWNGAPVIWKELWIWYMIVQKEDDWCSNEVVYSKEAKDYLVVKRNVDCYYDLSLKTIPFYFVREGKDIGIRIAGKDIPKFWEEKEVVQNHVYWMIDVENLNEWYRECFSKRKKAKIKDANTF